MQNLSEPIPELGNRTWEELEVVTHEDGHLLFKDQIRRRKADGSVEGIPVRVRIVRTQEIAEARAETRQLFGRIKSLDPDRDKDVFDELEQVCILSHAIRTFETPYSQFASYDELLTGYDEGSLQDIIGRIQALRQLLDPRESQLTEDQIWATIFAVAKRGHLFPLTDIAGFEQPSCIAFMASQAMRSPRGRAWLQSSGNSMPTPSTSENSDPSSPAAGSASG